MNIPSKENPSASVPLSNKHLAVLNSKKSIIDHDESDGSLSSYISRNALREDADDFKHVSNSKESKNLKRKTISELANQEYNSGLLHRKDSEVTKHLNNNHSIAEHISSDNSSDEVSDSIIDK